MDKKTKASNQPGFLKVFLGLWGAFCAAGSYFIFHIGLVGYLTIVVPASGLLSLLLALVWPLFFARSVKKVQEWKQSGDISSLIRWLNKHAPDPFSPAWKEAVNAVIEMGTKAVPALMEALETETPYVSPGFNQTQDLLLKFLRLNVVYCLGEIRDPTAIPALEAALNKYKDQEIRSLIEDALTKLNATRNATDQK